MTVKELYLLTLVFILVACETLPEILHSVDCVFTDMITKPDDSAKIEQLHEVSIHASCVIKCGLNEECESFVYDSTSASCTLYNTSIGVLSLTGAEKATRIQGECIRIYGKLHCFFKIIGIIARTLLNTFYPCTYSRSSGYHA
jgi:hypothetical protein